MDKKQNGVDSSTVATLPRLDDTDNYNGYYY